MPAHHLEHEIRVVVDHHRSTQNRQARPTHAAISHDHRPDHHRTLDSERVIRQAPTYREVYAAHERDHHITTSGRRALPARMFALPPGPDEERRGIAGRVPFDVEGRARSGLARLSMMHHRGEITARELDRARRRILARWPSIHRR